MDKNGLSHESNAKRLKAYHEKIDRMLAEGIIPDKWTADYLKDSFWWRGHVPMQLEHHANTIPKYIGHGPAHVLATAPFNAQSRHGTSFTIQKGEALVLINYLPGFYTMQRKGRKVYASIENVDKNTRRESLAEFCVRSEKEASADYHLKDAAGDMLVALKAAIAYDDAISRRGESGEVSLDPRAAVAEGKDLDTLYFDWINKSRAAIAKAEPKGSD